MKYTLKLNTLKLNTLTLCFSSLLFLTACGGGGGSNVLDTDGDGIAYNVDLDDDGDGFSDIDEMDAGLDPLDFLSFPKPFVITVDTRIISTSTTFPSSPDDQFMIPTEGEGYSYTVDCNIDDNKFEPDLTNQITDSFCQYDAPGIYTISISGIYPRIRFQAPFEEIDDSNKLLTIEQWGTGKWASMEGAFAGCQNMTYAATDKPNLTNVDSLSSMFSGARLFNGAIGNWDVSSVNIMNTMFSGAESFNQDISEWNVSSVSSMRLMFGSASAFNQDISRWEVGSVNIMTNMFLGASSFNQKIGGWDVSSVRDMSGMFNDASKFDQDLGGWDVSSVSLMNSMFDGASSFNKDINQWDVSSVILMRNMFKDATSFDQNIGGWDVNSVTNMEDMFLGAELLSNNYDSLLTGWLANGVSQGVEFNGGRSKISSNAAEDSRAKLVSAHDWRITDGNDTFEQ